MNKMPYTRPPITEAVIEIRFEENLSLDQMQKIRNDLQKNYSFSENIEEVGFKIDPKNKIMSKISEGIVGFKLTNEDQTEVSQIKQNSMVCSKLAPYSGWESFQPRAVADWDIWRKTTKNKKIDRIGVRFINRIDIPYITGVKIDLEDYLTVVPKYPEPDLISSFTEYTMQVKGPFVAEGFGLILNSHIVKSPLIDHFSVVLDLDLYPMGELPQRDDKIWELVNDIREHKNLAFEMCIKDNARKLFD